MVHWETFSQYSTGFMSFVWGDGKDVSMSLYWQASSCCWTYRQEVTVTWLRYRHLVQLHRGPPMYGCQHKYRLRHSYAHIQTQRTQEDENKAGQEEMFRVLRVCYSEICSWISTWLVFCGTIISSSFCSAPICPITLTPNFPKLSYFIIGPLCQDRNQAQCSN